jgi:1-deoxy-D-xylulose-5-phosphate synthase
MTLADTFIDHASPEAMYAAAGLTAADISRTAISALGVTVADFGKARA